MNGMPTESERPRGIAVAAWVLRMAWRDSRGSRRRMGVYVLSMVIGVAALVAINSFGSNLESAVDAQARTLLGADLSMESSRPFPDSVETWIGRLGGERSRRTSFSSMVVFPRTGDTRLATVRAMEPGFPWYGSIETDPPGAAIGWLEAGGALVDRTLAQQFGVRVGDSVRVGARTYSVQGVLVKTPRESAAVSLFSPRVYIPLAGLDSLLLDRGSRAEYETYFRFEDGRDVQAIVDTLGPKLRSARVGFDTVEESRENWDDALSNLYRFLGLVGFIALLLGSLGVSSAIHVYVRQRLDTVAVLRVFGARSGPTLAIYVVQSFAMGAVGALVGAGAGILLQMALPRLVADVLPVDVAFSIAWGAVATGVGVGVLVTVLFALLPLLSVRKVSPLHAIRSTVEPASRLEFDPVRASVLAVVALAVILVAVIQAPSAAFGLAYAAALAVVFLLLGGVARLLVWAVRRYAPASGSYTVRQGLANLHRPNNQTRLLMLSLGIGTFLIGLMSVTEATLLRQITVAGDESRANLVFFDIQRDQADGVEAVLRAEGLPVLERVPIVTMRLASVKGRSVAEIRADSSRGETWQFRREYRSTYRDSLTSSERLVAGTFVREVEPDAAVVPVSAERDIAAELGIGLGDTLSWDVQGVEVPTVVSSLREVDWRRVQTNFFFVFPQGVLESAPQFSVILSRAGDETASAAAQQAVVRAYPNVSAIDASLVLQVFDAIFSRIEFVIRFMALFSVLTGIVVLAGAVLSSRTQRIEETVLLKTLGASEGQVLRIMIVEYVALGLLAVSTGLLLAVGTGWLLALFVYDTPLAIEAWTLAAIVGGVVCTVLFMGAASSRGIYRRPALEVLRAET